MIGELSDKQIINNKLNHLILNNYNKLRNNDNLNLIVIISTRLILIIIFKINYL